MGWCNQSGSRLFTADLNGDGMTDMLCFSGGYKWTSLSAGTGAYFQAGTSW